MVARTPQEECVQAAARTLDGRESVVGVFKVELRIRAFTLETIQESFEGQARYVLHADSTVPTL
jgi:hypothetical protein